MRPCFKLGLEGLSNQEIADTLSVSIHTVKTQKPKSNVRVETAFRDRDYFSDVRDDRFFYLIFSKKTYFLSFFLSGQSFLV